MVNQYCAHSFARNWQLPFLNQRKGENDRRKYFMINLHERMLPTLAGVEPVTSWSQVGQRIQLSPKYWDTLSHFHTCLKIWTNPFSLLEVSKNLWLELQTGEPLPCWTWIFSTFANNVDPDHLASEEAKWSGSALFAIQYVNMYQQPGLSKPIGWKIEVGVAS